MSVYPTPEIDRIVQIDDNHAGFIEALVTCRKPRQVLEFGFGAGQATRSILEGLRYNQQAFDYTLVDNWLDFAGVRPAATLDAQYAPIKFVTSSERDFVTNCRASYDLILSDADHANAQDWFKPVYERLLSRGGILIYHDVTNINGFPNLLMLYEDTLRLGYHHVLFNQNSRLGERCDRGLLVIFKH